MKPCRAAKKTPAKPPSMAPMAKAESLTLVDVDAQRLAGDLVLAQRFPGAADRQLAQARHEQVGQQRQHQDQVVEEDRCGAPARTRCRRTVEGRHAVVDRRLEGQAEEGRARNRGDAVRAAGKLGPVDQDDADDLAEAERDDGEVVAAQAQRRQAEQHAEQRRPCSAGERQRRSRSSSRTGWTAARRCRRRRHRRRRSRGRAGRRGRPRRSGPSRA